MIAFGATEYGGERNVPDGSRGSATAVVRPGSDTLDGRRQRTIKTREAIISAIISLQEEGDSANPGPATAAAIARRAGVSLRSIFMHFPTQETMTLAVMDELEPRLTKELVTQTPSGTLRIRVDDFVKRRAVLLDTLVAYRRSAAALSPNPTIGARRRRIRHRLKEEVAVVFAPEFACHAPRERRLLLDAVSVLCESESWDSMRRYYDRSGKGACDVLRLGIEKLLS